MYIVDAHTHIFDRYAGINSGLPTTSDRFGKIRIGNKLVQTMPPQFERTDSIPEMLIATMDAFDVSRAIVLSNGGYGYNNHYLKKAVDTYHDRLAALALVDITGGKAVAQELDVLIREDNFKGIKVETLSCFQCSGDWELDDPRINPIWDSCDANGAIVMFHISREGDLVAIRRLTKRFSKLRIVIAHFGSETIFRYGAFSERKEMLFSLASECERIWLDTSTLTYYTREFFNFSQAVSLIMETYQKLGANRLLWGSDYPCMLLFATYRQLLDIVRTGCAKIPMGDMERIIGYNAIDLFWNS